MLIGLFEEGTAEAFHANVIAKILPSSLAILDSRLAGPHEVTQAGIITNKIILMLRPIGAVL